MDNGNTTHRYPIGRETAKAWLLTVINPSIRALKTESEYLGRGELTWLASRSDFEVIGRFQESIKSEYLPNYEHFLFLNPDVQDRVNQYLEQAGALQDASSNLQNTIESSAELVEAYDETTTESGLQKLNVSKIEELFGSYNRERQLRYIAQLIVNTRGELDHYYTAYKLWNAHRDRFLQLRTTPRIRIVAQQLEAARTTMQRCVDGLGSLLAKIRNRLVEDYDVPPAPLESTL